MARKEVQIEINRIAEKEFTAATEEFFDNRYSAYSNTQSKRLRSCNAWVYETENYFILRSYNTLVACINKNTDTLSDVLRTVYGYTSTSAQHISKFNHDYCKGHWGCSVRLVAR